MDLKLLKRQLEFARDIKEVPLLNEEKVNQYIRETYPQSLNEMARVNKKEVNSLFPYNKFSINVYGNDHEPPHVHVIVDDWDIRVEIESGKIISTKKVGSSSKMYRFVEKYINDWFDTPNLLNNKITNREASILLWNAEN